MSEPTLDASRLPVDLVEASPLTLVQLALEYRRLLLTIPTVLCIVFGARALLSERTYTTALYFVPQAPSNPAAEFAGLAAQLGINVGSGTGGESPDFYVELVRSYAFLRDLAVTRYSARRDGVAIQGDVAALYRLDLGDSARTVAAAAKLMANSTTASVDPKSQVVEMNITTFDPDLSVEVGRRVVELVNAFNSHARQSMAVAERTFVQGRMVEAEGELRQAEAAVLAFMLRNRDFRNSPQLAFEYDHLEREMQRRQDVYNSLVQAFEQARIDEVRNTPVITVVQEPVRPARPDSRRVVVKVIVAGVVGGLIAFLLAAGAETRRRLVLEEPDTSEKIARGWNALRSELRYPLRTFRQWFLSAKRR